MSGDGQSRAPTFPPPLWGRDREGGTTRTASVWYLMSIKTQPLLSSLFAALASLAAFYRPPPPCPPPTWGEGTVRRAPSQLTQCVCGWMLEECADGVVWGERQAQ